MKRTMELVINSRPDRAGILWFMLKDPEVNNPDHWGGRIARYFDANLTFPLGSISTQCHQTFVGLDTAKCDCEGQPMTVLVRRISEYLSGHPLNARFTNATHEMVNAGDADADLVSPVLYFRIDVRDSL